MSSFLQHINKNCQALEIQKISTILILIDEEKLYIGDSCKKFTQIKMCQSFFPNAAIDMNFNNRSHIPIYKAILKNNPYVKQVLDLSWENIPFHDYDIVICVTPNEELLLELLAAKYGRNGGDFDFKTAVFSRSDVTIRLIDPFNNKCKQVFPAYVEMLENLNVSMDVPLDEIYISQEEKEWGNSWFEERGVKKDEQVALFVDVTSNMNKSLKITTYFELLSHYLSFEKNKVLIFDENGIGKESIYECWLGEELASKVLISKQQPFRNDLCLMASDYMKFVLGPCTGLLHCASAIYNYFVRNGFPQKSVPLMVVYAGKYPDCPGYTPNMWWGDSPLINCMVLRQIDGKPVISLLTDMNEDEKNDEDSLLCCKEYTPEMVIDFITKKIFNKPVDRALAM
jgi:hypothetical protein